jgi:hypothetical protein
VEISVTRKAVIVLEVVVCVTVVVDVSPNIVTVLVGHTLTKLVIVDRTTLVVEKAVLPPQPKLVLHVWVTEVFRAVAMPSKTYNSSRKSIFIGLNVSLDVTHRKRSISPGEDGGSNGVCLIIYLYLDVCFPLTFCLN